MKSVKLFSDGSCLGNPGIGGWAYILEFNGHEKCECGGEMLTTNNKMELRAAIEGLKALKEPCEVKIFTDSSYVTNSINGWLEKWVAKNFKGKKNVELWREFLRVSAMHKISAFWVKRHAEHPQNERSDEMARNFAQNLKGA